MYNCNDSKSPITEGISDGLSRPGKPTRSHKSCSPFEVNMKVYQTRNINYTKTSMVRTPVARLPRLFRTRSQIPKCFSLMQILLGIIREILFILKMYVVCMNKNRLDKAILMSIHNILLF